VKGLVEVLVAGKSRFVFILSITSSSPLAEGILFSYYRRQSSLIACKLNNNDNNNIATWLLLVDRGAQNLCLVKHPRPQKYALPVPSRGYLPYYDETPVPSASGIGGVNARLLQSLGRPRAYYSAFSEGYPIRRLIRVL